MSEKTTYEELENRIQELEKTESKLKSSEAELRESQQVIKGILNTIPARVFWKDQNLVFLGCNKLFAQDVGFADPKDIVGKDDYQIEWRDQAELYRKDDHEVIDSGDSKFFIEEPQTTPEGDTITLLTSKTPLRNDTGDIIGMLGRIWTSPIANKLKSHTRDNLFNSVVLKPFDLQKIKEVIHEFIPDGIDFDLIGWRKRY